MKTPSGTFIFIVFVLIAIVSVVIFQACANQPGKVLEDKKFTVKIGKMTPSLLSIKPGHQNAFDAH